MKNKTIKAGILILVILNVIILTILNYIYFKGFLSNFLEKQISTLGYFGVFVSVFILEFIPQPFFSALVPFTTGLLFNLNSLYLILIMVDSAILANYTAYVFGRYYGVSIVKHLISGKNYQKSLKWFEKYGNLSITILALTPLPYFPIMGGIFKMSFREFTIYAIIPRIIHLAIFSYLIILLI